MSEYSLGPFTNADGREVIDIFNYYIEKTFAAYPSQKMPYEFFDMFLQLTRGYPSVTSHDSTGRLLGFGMLRAHNPITVFRRTAEVTCFVHPEYTGQGIGSQMLAHLEDKGKIQGINVILASISSLNEGSIRFHSRHGFVECGRFRNVAEKNGTIFDTVWMEKFL